MLCFLVLGEGGEEGGNEKEEGEEKEGDESGDDEIADLDILLRKEREREKKRKVEDPQADEVGYIINFHLLKVFSSKFCSEMTWSLQLLQGDEVEDDPDKLKPYKTDLEYLDDHFQVTQCTIPH